jgi:SAM-dependent methyltransferase
MTDMDTPRPNCPVTGLPAARLIQMVSSRLLQDLWRYGFRVDARRQLGRVKRFGLWESPCGLAFFDPMIMGDSAFYKEFYDRFGWHERIASATLRRPEFSEAAALAPAGARVLDVGAGKGGFARFVAHARYVGLEPNADRDCASPDIRREAIAEHARANPGAYDMVCAFQVIEHVGDPVAFAAAMVDCLKPGGRLILGVPCWPSPLTGIPDLAMNAPPHHLTWWTQGALRALAARLGLVVDRVEGLPNGSHDALFYWMSRLSPPLTGRYFFRARKSWYLGLAWAWLAGRVAAALFPAPADATPMTLLLSARRPA